jgi:predicted nucleic acid-binding protein
MKVSLNYSFPVRLKTGSSLSIAPKPLITLIADAGMTYLVDANVLSEPTKQTSNGFETVVETIECLPWDATVSRQWACLIVDLRQKGKTVPLLDGMIAATALQHDLTVATRNTRDFRKTGVKTVNPFE